MKCKHFYAVLAMLIGCTLAGCRSDIDLNNIDPTAQVDLGVALPVGSLHTTIGDFFGTGVGKFYVDSLDNRGVITWKDTFTVAKEFHKVDLAQYISSADLHLKVYDQIPAMLMIGTNKQITGMGIPITLKFDMPLTLSGINDKDSLANERLDSAQIQMASFSSILNTHNLPLEWDWIDTVRLIMGEQIRRPEGDTMLIYEKHRDTGYGYNQTIPTEVDHFTINLMKNGTPGEVVDTCTFKILFTFTVPTGETVTIPEDASLDYQLGVQFIDYTAIWGKFARSKDMYDENEVDLGDSWGSLDIISKSNVPFADPRIEMHITTKVAGAMKLDGDYLYALDADGEKHYATFLRGAQTYRNFPKQFEEGEYLDPITSALEDSTTNMMIKFDKDPTRGHIDELFQYMPKKIGYKFGVDFNYQMTPQIRIQPSTSIGIMAICTLPMIFNKGVHLEYSDTIRDVNLSKLSIDSLLASVNVIDSLRATDIHIVLKALNEIPLDVKASLRCLDESGNVIMDPADNTKPFLLFTNGTEKQDTIMLKAPNYVREGGSWLPKTPGETTIIAGLTKAELELFPKIKNIRYTAIIDDTSLQDAYSRGLENIRIAEDQGLTIKIGIAAQVDAILNLGITGNNGSNGNNGNNNTNH